MRHEVHARHVLTCPKSGNNPNSEQGPIFQPNNAIAIGTFIDDPEDRELLELIPYLESLASIDDVTKMLAVV